MHDRESISTLATPLEIVEREMRPYAQDVQWEFRSIDFNTQQSYSDGTSRRYPICSCFKLAVLGAWFAENPDPRALQEIVRINNDQLQPGVGVLKLLSPPLNLRIEHLLQLMMSHSDGTATDVIIEELGKPAIQAYLTRYAPDTSWQSPQGDMVRAANEKVAHLPELEVRRAWTRVLDEMTALDDYTTAKDLLRLLLSLLNSPSSELHRILKTVQPAQWFAYWREGAELYGKTGSLGGATACNDSAALFTEGRPHCVFALTSLG